MFQKGPANPRWKGGKYVTAKGYVRISAGCNRGKYEHRVIAESIFGPLPNGVEIHHKDTDKSNNTPDNLDYVDTCLHSFITVVSDQEPEWINNDTDWEEEAWEDERE